RYNRPSFSETIQQDRLLIVLSRLAAEAPAVERHNLGRDFERRRKKGGDSLNAFAPRVYGTCIELGNNFSGGETR
ncbi:MAG TPA: hypothetical protein VKB94_03860, partial [Rhizomicrobium sp.]|nr:hypothetical protein [Rhizomicrobium sp.]